MALQQLKQRLGTVFGAMAPDPQNSFLQPSGLVGPGHLMSVLARRHMHLYGTRREAFAEVAISTRENAKNRPKARKRTPLTLEDYFAAPLIAEPLCKLDFCLETDGPVAVITTPWIADAIFASLRCTSWPPRTEDGANRAVRSPGSPCPTPTSRRRVMHRSPRVCTRRQVSDRTTSTSH